MVYKLYGSPMSPYFLVAAISIKLVGGDYEQIPVLPHNDDPEFVKASPLGKIPALVDGDFSIADSTAIAVYVDAVASASGSSSLFGSDPATKARIAFFEKFAQSDGTTISSKLVGIMFRTPDDTEALTEAKKEALKTIEFLEKHVQDNGHFVGSTYTAADVAIYSHLTAYQLFEVLDADKFPKLSDFYKKANELPAFSEPADASKEMAAKFFAKK